MIGKNAFIPPSQRQPLLRFVLYPLSFILFLTVLGCQTTGGGLDSAYLDESAPPVRGGALMPARPGLLWLSENRDGQIAVTMQTRCLGPQTVAGRAGSRYDVRINDLPFQQEVYEERADGALSGLATGPDARIRITPPLPIAPPTRDIRAGVVRTWRGVLADTKTGQRFPAEARIRIGGRDTIKTKLGPLAAYRFDIGVRVRGDSDLRVSTLWLSPGVGIVRQRIAVAPGRVARFELVSFSGLPKRMSQPPAPATAPADVRAASSPTL